MLSYLLAGLIGVSNMIIWGLYGDLMVEKFYLRKVVRSLVLGLVWAGLIYTIDPAMPLLVVALVTIALERCSTEIYKALYRTEDQSKYLIPSEPFAHISLLTRRLLAIATISIIVICLYLDPISSLPSLLIAVITGFIIAVGGMAKDAPHEGFEKLKFFRSPAIALITYLGLSLLYPEIGGTYLLLSIAGGERIISEFYKKILRGKVPGKFNLKTYSKPWQNARRWLLPIYAANIALLISLIFVGE